MKIGVLPLMLALCCDSSFAANELPPIAWERSAARAVISQGDHDTAARALMDLTIAGANLDILNLLEHTRTRPDWPAPVRDAAVYRYAQLLRSLPSSAVGPDVLTYLKAYPVLTVVPDADHPQGMVPLFNVRAAATGLDNSWKRQDALLEGLALLDSNPRSLADAFMLEDRVAVQQGFRQALTQASPDQLQALNRAAEKRLASSPALTPLFADAAALSGDPAALAALLQKGRGAAIAPMLRSTHQTLDISSRSELLLIALEQAPPENRALAIAELAPGIIGSRAIDEALLEHLGDPLTGASAALALAGSPSEHTARALKQIAGSTPGLAASRAELAMQTRRSADGVPTP